MTSNSAVFAVAVPAAITGAASFGLASAMQQRVAQQVPRHQALNPRLLVELVRRPVWVVSLATVTLGLSLQVVALAFGPLVLVQPLLVTGVLFGAVFAAWIGGRQLDRIVALGALGCAGGLAAFLLLAQPSGAAAEFNGRSVLPLASVLGLLLVACLVAAKSFPGEIGAIALATATGVLYGVTAGLMKVVAGHVRLGGLGEPFHHWALYVVCVVGPTGFLLSQNTFQHGKLISPALAVITTVDPLVGIAIGMSWLGEAIVTTPPALAGEVASGVVIVAAIAVLTHRAEHLRRAAERARERGPGEEATWG